MKTKEEVIKEAYGEYWYKMPHELKEISINSNGWIRMRDCIQYLGQDFSYSDELETKEVHYGVHKQRPISLQGLENNNGWIRIESEENLPKIDGEYWFLKDGEIQIFNRVCSYYPNSKHLLRTATHYQPIVKPKTPLY